MKRLVTTYATLPLKSPLVIASSGLTGNIENIEMLEQAGAGAIVLKSLFEEEIMEKAQSLQEQSNNSSPEAFDYLNTYTRAGTLQKYLDLIRLAKKQVKIPIIASINCASAGSWKEFASQMEAAGADAIELNVMYIDSDPEGDLGRRIKIHVEILEQVKKGVKIPVIMKLGANVGNVSLLVNRLQAAGVDGVVFFNKPFMPDIDINTLSFKASGHQLSSPNDYGNSLRWLGIVSAQQPRLSLIASNGIHTPESAIKAILAGACAVELCSALYLHGFDIIAPMNQAITEWLETNNFDCVSDACGILNRRNIANCDQYERMQFMKWCDK